MAKIYAASSWRNKYQQNIVEFLGSHNHEVYDFRNPAFNTGFAWKELDSGWETWDLTKYRELLLSHPRAAQGFMSDYRAMQWADTGLLICPCGRSAHLEAGYFNGANKRLIVYIPEPQEPDLMYLMAQHIVFSREELLKVL